MRTTFAGVSMRARPSYHQQLYPCLKNGAHHTMSTGAAARIANRGLRMWKYPPSWIPVTVLTLSQAWRGLSRGSPGGFGIPCEEVLRSALRRRWPVSGLAGVSGAGGRPSARRSPTLRSIRFRPSRRLLCFRLSLKFTLWKYGAQVCTIAQQSLRCAQNRLWQRIA